jgi:uncharacterized metal-binding protein
MTTSAEKATADFSLAIDGVEGYCPAGEKWARQNMMEKKIPVFACEGPCIRGEIARLAANIVAKEMPQYARCCYAEVALVPHSAMARWAKEAERAVVIDGCFLECIGRVVNNVVDRDKVIHIDAHPLYRKYNDVFLMDDVPEEERKAVARSVADKIISKLREQGATKALS